MLEWVSGVGFELVEILLATASCSVSWLSFSLLALLQTSWFITTINKLQGVEYIPARTIV
jgi:hypothetical protein